MREARIALGLSLFYLGLVLLLPLAALLARVFQDPLGAVRALLAPRALHALGLSLGLAALAGALSLLLGFLFAWALVRGGVPGRRALEWALDLPLVLPTAVAGLTLTALFAPEGPYGRFLPLAYTPWGILVAMTFVALPFAARTLEAALLALPRELELVAQALGASPGATFRRVLLPALKAPLLSGYSLAFARALGEYGSVVFIAGNLPFRTETAPVLIAGYAESGEIPQAAALGLALMGLALFALTLLAFLERARLRRPRRA